VTGEVTTINFSSVKPKFHYSIMRRHITDLP